MKRVARSLADLALLALLVGVVATTTVWLKASQTRGDAPEGYQSTSLVLAGTTIACQSNGRPVIWEARHTLNDVGMTIPAGQWTVVRYNPLVLNTMPDRLKLFWLGHECGHAYLRTTNESSADCWSATTGVNQGWFNKNDVDTLAIAMKDNPGDLTHPPGPDRIANIRQCMSQAHR
jgi:hypothetical protein